jgi:hypothetical protein
MTPLEVRISNMKKNVKRQHRSLGKGRHPSAEMLELLTRARELAVHSKMTIFDDGVGPTIWETQIDEVSIKAFRDGGWGRRCAGKDSITLDVAGKEVFKETYYVRNPIPVVTWGAVDRVHYVLLVLRNHMEKKTRRIGLHFSPPIPVSPDPDSDVSEEVTELVTRTFRLAAHAKTYERKDRRDPIRKLRLAIQSGRLSVKDVRASVKDGRLSPQDIRAAVEDGRLAKMSPHVEIEDVRIVREASGVSLYVRGQRVFLEYIRLPTSRGPHAIFWEDTGREGVDRVRHALSVLRNHMVLEDLASAV